MVNDAGFNNTLKWTYTWISDSPDNYGKWNFKFAEAGEYQLEAYTASAYSEWDQTPYQIKYNGQVQTVTIDQTAVDGWQNLGTFSFAQGGEQWVRIDDNVAAQDIKRKVVFDAIRLTRNLPAPPQDMMVVLPADDMHIQDATVVTPREDMAQQPVVDQYVSPITLDLGPNIIVDARVVTDLEVVEGDTSAKSNSGCQSKQSNIGIWALLILLFTGFYSKAFKPVKARPTAKV